MDSNLQGKKTVFIYRHWMPPLKKALVFRYTNVRIMNQGEGGELTISKCFYGSSIWRVQSGEYTQPEYHISLNNVQGC